MTIQRPEPARTPQGYASMAVTGLWIALLIGGSNLWLPILLFGYIVIIPLVALLYGDETDRAEWWDEESWDDWWGTSESEDANERETASTETQSSTADESTPGDALETLRERYAAGEITDDQFERKLERLLETESLEDVEQRHQRTRETSVRDRDRNRTPEYET
ncbi:hypothetical protein C482_15643 [Natrialba chahannaoensis JCM 10990]|uniref:SHOCT domain-containing protein n=1 Tax=Natrialba chahannaoensis JCM 10990 TaxID=1227492 RepID=M0AGS5_9EURY|nr:hypothetical protein C482_15643 [Natrialba chahannaoensis JCM 10990]